MAESQDKLVRLLKDAQAAVKKADISDEKLKVEAFNFALRVLWEEEYKPKTRKR